MKHYIIIGDWANEYGSDITIFGVAHSMEEAKEKFYEAYENEKEYALENDFTIYEDTDIEFDAGEDGFYMNNHTRLYIQEVM